MDLQALNGYAISETHHTQRPFHQARSVPQGTKKTVCDAWNGYHSVPLHPDDKHVTTFITPWVAIGIAQLARIRGVRRWLTRRFDEIISHIPNKVPRDSLWEILQICGVPRELSVLVPQLYTDTTARCASLLLCQKSSSSTLA